MMTRLNELIIHYMFAFTHLGDLVFSRVDLINDIVGVGTINGAAHRLGSAWTKTNHYI